MRRKGKGVTPIFPEFGKQFVPELPAADRPVISRDGFLPGLRPDATPAPVTNEHWRAIYDAYLQSPVWHAKRSSILGRAGGRCERCGKDCSKLEVHHRTYERFGGRELLTDLEALCTVCHPVADKERRNDRATLADLAASDSAFDRGFDTWMTRRTEDWQLEDDSTIEHERERFVDWIERKNEREDAE